MTCRTSELILTCFAECYHDNHSVSKKAPYSPELNDVWSLGVLFLDLACGDRIWEEPTARDERFRKFSEDPSDFLRSEYPLNDRTRYLLLRIFSPEPLRISLKALREEISSIDDFYLSDYEIAAATAQVQKNAMRYGPWTKLGDGLDDISHEYRAERSFTDSRGSSSMGEFFDVSLTTLENRSSHFSFKKDSARFPPCITDLGTTPY